MNNVSQDQDKTFMDKFCDEPEKTLDEYVQKSLNKNRILILNANRKVTIVIYAALVLIMCTFFVPQNIYSTRTSGQGVYHTISIRIEYHPIWYNTQSYDDNNKSVLYTNGIDFSRLLIQLFTTTVILGMLFIFAPYEEWEK
jgi:hypothetical protein